MLSRLKGMETNLNLLRGTVVICFGYAFPFEGNGNAGPRRCSQKYAFAETLDMLSRLKGMETCLCHRSTGTHRFHLWICFPV